MAVDASGNLYFTDNGRVRKIANNIITTVAGIGPTGIGWDDDIGDGRSALQAKTGPGPIAIDARGDLLIGDGIGTAWNEGRIRRVSNGIISTIAGAGASLADGGPALSGQLFGVTSAAVGPDGRLYIADEGNGRVRMVKDSVINTVAGNGRGSFGGTGDGGPAVDASVYPHHVAVDSAARIYVANGSTTGIVRMISNGQITTLAGNAMGYRKGEDGPATEVSFDTISGLAADNAGTVYISELGRHRVRKISGGNVTTVAGTGSAGYSGDNGPADQAQLNSPQGLAVDSAGNLYIADTRNRVIRKVSGGVITRFAGPFDEPNRIALDRAGNVYVSDIFVVKKVANGTTSVIAGGGTAYGEGGVATEAKLVNGASSLAIDDSGYVYLADSANNRIRVLIPSTAPAVVSAASHSLGPLAPDSIATLYGSEMAGKLTLRDSAGGNVRPRFSMRLPGRSTSSCRRDPQLDPPF